MRLSICQLHWFDSIPNALVTKACKNYWFTCVPAPFLFKAVTCLFTNIYFRKPYSYDMHLDILYAHPIQDDCVKSQSCSQRGPSNGNIKWIWGPHVFLIWVHWFLPTNQLRKHQKYEVFVYQRRIRHEYILLEMHQLERLIRRTICKVWRPRLIKWALHQPAAHALQGQESPSESTRRLIKTRANANAAKILKLASTNCMSWWSTNRTLSQILCTYPHPRFRS